MRALSDKTFVDEIIDVTDEFTITRVPTSKDIKFESAENSLVLEQYLTVLFRTVDLEYSDILNHKTIRKLFLSTSLDLSEDELLSLFVVLKENNEGHVNYRNFINQASPLIRILKSRGKLPYDGALSQDQKKLVEMYINYKYNFIYKLAINIFVQADSTFTGYLPRFVFLDCLNNPLLGLTEKEINMIMSLVEENKDGSISYKYL